MPKIVTAVKSVKQPYQLTPGLLQMMETFRQMVNDCLRIGITKDVSTLKRLCKLCYPVLARYDIVTYYKLHAISKAAGILKNRKQSVRRGYPTKAPYMKRASLTSSYGFKVANGILQIPLGGKQYFDIPINSHVKRILSNPAVTVCSFTLAANNAVSICYSRQVGGIECITTTGIDRNLANITYGNCEQVIIFDVSKAVKVTENTRSVVRSFRRNDARIRKMITDKYGRRRRNRVHQLLHKVSNAIVQDAKATKAAIVFEDISFIRRLYRRGNGQGREYRSRMNSQPFHELKRQVEYKAAWEDVEVITLTKGKTRGTSQLCPRCGKRLQEAGRDDPFHKRQLWCPGCESAMNVSVKGRAFLSDDGKGVFKRPKGPAGEAMRGNPMTAPVILRVDAGKLSLSRWGVGRVVCQLKT